MKTHKTCLIVPLLIFSRVLQVTIIQPGGFDTGGAQRTPWAPPHPAYAGRALPSIQMRDGWSGFTPTGDARKAMEAVYRLALLEDPPLRLPLGKGAVAAVKAHAEVLKANVEAYGSWSEDLDKDV